MIGLVGGLGPESTIDYYRRIVERYKARNDGASPPIIITSLDFRTVHSCIAEGKLDTLRDYLWEAVRSLSSAGATVAAITANTPHIVFDAVLSRSPIQMVSIVEAALDAAVRRGFRKLAILGTEYTMNARFYPKVFEKSGLSLIVPSKDQQRFIHEIYVNELLAGVFKTDTRSRIASIVAEMASSRHVDAVILAGTELPILFAGNNEVSIPMLDTTDSHVDAILQQAVVRDIGR